MGVSAGVAIGKAVVIEDQRTAILYVPIRQEEVSAETDRLEDAVESTRSQLDKLRAKVADAMGEEHANILDAHLLMLEDEMFVGAIKRTIAQDHVNAEWALKGIVASLRKRFQDFEDSYFQERGRDVEDVGNRIQRNLAGVDPHGLADLQGSHILVARDLSPADAALLDGRYIQGVALEEGGRTSHTAIIAKSLRIPAVLGVAGLLEQVHNDELMVLDGDRGEVLASPSDDTLAEYEGRRELHRQHEQTLLMARDLPSVTADGHKVFLQANIEFPNELEQASHYGAEGIGLYRSEFLFVDRLSRPPSELEQYEVYRKLAETVYPSSAIVRTLDFGGGKDPA